MASLEIADKLFAFSPHSTSSKLGSGLERTKSPDTKIPTSSLDINMSLDDT
jgi:hypothetical protein